MKIGLFGSCATHSGEPETWRNEFLHLSDFEIYNPQKVDWNPTDAQIEKEHLYNDDIIVFAITPQSFSFASILEVYFSILRCVENNQKLFIVITDAEIPHKQISANISKLFNNAITIVKEHLFIRNETHFEFTKSDFKITHLELENIQDKLEQYVLKVINGKNVDNAVQLFGEVEQTSIKNLIQTSQSMRDKLKFFIEILNVPNVFVCESILEIKARI